MVSWSVPIQLKMATEDPDLSYPSQKSVTMHKGPLGLGLH